MIATFEENERFSMDYPKRRETDIDNWIQYAKISLWGSAEDGYFI